MNSRIDDRKITYKFILAVVLAAIAVVAATGGGPSVAQAPNQDRGVTVEADGKASVSTAYDPRELNPSNPLRRGKWATYLGPTDQLGAPYANATGANRQQLAKLALAPRAVWFGQWLSADGITLRTQRYLAAAKHGDPNAIPQIAVFSMEPWEGAICKRMPTRAERAGYYRWMKNFAAGVGRSRVVLILQPDLPFARCFQSRSTLPLKMIANSAKLLSKLPNATVYLDAGSAQWPSAGQGGVKNALTFLIPAGVRYTRGIALNATHYGYTSDQIVRGAELVQALSRRGIKGKKVVINTAANGRPFDFGSWQRMSRTKHLVDPPVCRSRTQKGICVAIGIPPTWNVSSAKWGLSARNRKLAATYVDGYLWIGRPWLKRQNNPFILTRALALARADKW